MARFIHIGDTIDYTPGTDVTSGAVVVQGSLVGIAVRDIAANTLGALRVTGVHEFPKATGQAIAAGSAVHWDATAGRATTTTTNNAFIGKAVKAAATADTEVWVRLSQ
jgi:predicted RecA/RadA family phage recombinase